MKRTLLPAVLSIAMAGAIGCTPAHAHAQLRKAMPPVGGTVAAPPTQLTLTFSEGVEPAFSGLELRAANGQPVPTGKGAVKPGDQATLIVPITARMAPGTYQVTWHAVSVDTHKTQGSFSFTIKP